MSEQTGRFVGYIVGEVQPQEFLFVSSRELMPPRLEYLVVPGVEERRGEGAQRVNVLAQVMQLEVDSAILSGSLTFEETQTILDSRLSPSPRLVGTARVIGYLAGGSVHTPRCVAMPGQKVHLASDELLRDFFTKDIEGGLEIGTLINRPGVAVALDVNGLRRHLAVIAQTGAGKSYLVGKILEALVQLGATVLVFDPNSDYVQLRKLHEDAEKPYPAARQAPFAHNVDIYRIPGIQGRRYSDEMVGPTRDFTIKFSALDGEEVCDLAGVPSGATRIREAIDLACNDLMAAGSDYRPMELMERLHQLAAQRVEGARKAVRYIELIEPYPVWGFRDVEVEDLIRPQRISVVDLAGAERTISAYVADKALREIWARATSGQLPYPVFVVLEEAHNLVPAERQGFASRASRIINTVASEGRKFKVFLVVVTQRPSKISPDTLSQCGSQIIMQLTNPEDQKAVRQASEALSEDLLANLPGLNTGEAIVLGQLTRVPAMVRVGQRLSAEGGADVDLAETLRRALADARTQALVQAQRPPLVEPREEEWL